jgi:hypothetical protein
MTSCLPRYWVTLQRDMVWTPLKEAGLSNPRGQGVLRGSACVATNRCDHDSRWRLCTTHLISDSVLSTEVIKVTVLVRPLAGAGFS